MTDVVSAARTARESLAQGLNALQRPGVPDQLMAVAEPIAKAMSNLHRVESSGGALARELAPIALESVRSALAMLQSAPNMHPAVDAALEAVAGSLGIVHQLASSAGSVRPSAAAPAASNPALGATVALSPGAPAPQQVAPAFVQPAPMPAPAFVPPAPVVPQAAQTPIAEQPQRAAPVVQPLQTGPAAVDSFATTRQSRGVPAMGEPESRFAPNSTMPSQGVRPSGNAAAKAAAPVYGTGPTQPEAGAIAAPAASNLPRVEVALGAHSPTNFYKGLSGNDVVDAGGIFVATYQIPKIGTPLQLVIALPGGYEFQAQVVVRWTRDPSSVSDGSSPGFGAQFTSISPEGRQLVYRYVRNREPLFHDDF